MSHFIDMAARQCSSDSLAEAGNEKQTFYNQSMEYECLILFLNMITYIPVDLRIRCQSY